MTAALWVLAVPFAVMCAAFTAVCLHWLGFRPPYWLAHPWWWLGEMAEAWRRALRLRASSPRPEPRPVRETEPEGPAVSATAGRGTAPGTPVTGAVPPAWPRTGRDPYRADDTVTDLPVIQAARPYAHTAPEYAALAGQWDRERIAQQIRDAISAAARDGSGQATEMTP